MKILKAIGCGVFLAWCIAIAFGALVGLIAIGIILFESHHTLLGLAYAITVFGALAFGLPFATSQ